jgi:hypothetical protein
MLEAKSEKKRGDDKDTLGSNNEIDNGEEPDIGKKEIRE